MTIFIEDINREEIIEIDSFWIGDEIVFSYIVNMIYNDGEPDGMDEGRAYLFDKEDIEYAITICKNILNDKSFIEDFPNHKKTTNKVIKTLKNIGDKCYITWYI